MAPARSDHASVASVRADGGVLSTPRVQHLRRTKTEGGVAINSFVQHRRSGCSIPRAATVLVGAIKGAAYKVSRSLRRRTVSVVFGSLVGGAFDSLTGF
jgi:hypothetical protein